jgi:hypothetical protein
VVDRASAAPTERAQSQRGGRGGVTEPKAPVIDDATEEEKED